MSIRGSGKTPSTLLKEGYDCHKAGDMKAAERCYRRILKQNKKHVEALYLLGSLYSQTGDQKRAEAALRAALRENPTHLEALYNFSRVLMDTDRNHDASAALLKVLAINPKHISANRNLGVVYLRLGDPDKAVPFLKEALALDPHSADTWCDLGLALSQTECTAVEGDDEAAAKAFDRAIQLEDLHARARHNRGHLRLRNQDYADGWADYEYRKLDLKSGFEPRPFTLPEWHGEDLNDKTILVWGEQGLGDQILHASIIPDLVKSAGRVIVECESRLQTLFARSFPKAEVYSQDTPPVESLIKAQPDMQIAMCSLGRIFRPHADSFQNIKPYLQADLEGFSLGGLFSDQHRVPLKIGLSWRSAREGLGPYKSTDLIEHWAPVFEARSDSKFFSLQYGPVDSDLKAVQQALGIEIVADHGVDPTRDLDGLASLISKLDLVITTSNTTAHLAGALGVPTWCLVPTGPGRLWYWHKKPSKSLWYPSMRLYWQKHAGEWGDPFARVSRDLAGHAF
ncbi:MAG: tetratricopeptide repeat-containing glycosyltransferase family protein [Rhodospirillaceae bacterium]